MIPERIPMSTQQIEISMLESHPDNPRLFLRDEVVGSIAAQLAVSGDFDEVHALIVRPVNGHFQVIQGHHRLEAARRAGLACVPCWVREMDDAEAYMQLALGNAQDGLSPLEIGIHALRVISLSGGGRGKNGGLAEYAEQMAKSKMYISQVRQAAEVFNIIKNSKVDFTVLSNKAQHLAAIHKAPADLWPALVAEMLDREWSAKETESEIKKVNSLLDSIPTWWSLDKSSIGMIALDEGKAKSYKAMFELAAQAESDLKPVIIYRLYETEEIKTENEREYRKWTSKPEEYNPFEIFKAQLIGLSSLPDKKEVNQIRAEILGYIQDHSRPKEEWMPILTDEEWTIERNRLAELHRITLREYYTPRLIQADILDGFRQIANDTIELICTDPPYNIGKADWDEFETTELYLKWSKKWLKECYRVLKSNGSFYIFGRFIMLRHLSLIAEEIGFIFQRKITWDTIQGSGGSGLWPIRDEDILYFSKNDEPYENPDAVKLERHEEHVREYKGKEYVFKSPSTVWRFPCVDEQNPERTGHPTQKPIELIERIIVASSPPGGIVLDCFLGSGTTGVAAMKNNRRSIGIEKNAEYVKIAKGRFDATEINDEE